MKVYPNIKKANRKLKIGVTAPPVMDFAMRGPAAPRSSMRPKQKPVPMLNKTEKLLSKVQECSIKTEQKKRPSVDFKSFVQGEKSFAGQDLFFFLPREKHYEEEMAKNPLVFARRHAFPTRQKVIAKIKQWKNLMRGTDGADMKKASEITIRSLDHTDRPIGSIAFSFKSFDKCCTDEKSYVALMCNYIKQ